MGQLDGIAHTLALQKGNAKPQIGLAGVQVCEPGYNCNDLLLIQSQAAQVGQGITNLQGQRFCLRLRWPVFGVLFIK